MEKIYLIPGLGYDCRMFENLNFKNYRVECLNWIDPHKRERLNDYAHRMCKTILDDTEEIVIIGHSLGGILAQEIAAIRKVRKIILISSIRSRKELPLHFRIVAPLKLHHLFTKELCIKTVRYWGGSHGFKNDHLKELFKSMVGKHSNAYLQWALKSLSEWDNPRIPESTSIFQIHGTSDKTLPFKYIRNPDLTIENGSHILAYKRFDEINEVILNQIKAEY